MKILILCLAVILSLSSQALEKFKGKKVVKKKDKIEAVVAPCDSKDDILKKLEEKKKAESMEAGKPKAFSLQGGDTGCKIK
jgi:hypothetical protein